MKASIYKGFSDGPINNEINCCKEAQNNNNRDMTENIYTNNDCTKFVQHTFKEGNMSGIEIEKAKELQNSIEAVGEAYREEISNLLDRIRQDQRDFTLAVADLEANNTLLRWDEVNLHYRLGQLA